ncbi:YybH family protein [Plantactinospora sp. GCM10030261]|uniref:YybH family protein n=1 Tax=Plantactinospora sp. GCM10030261 TaxID=3273420 RepID=UPI00360CE62E
MTFDVHPDSVPLTDDPAQHPFVFARAFNTGDARLVDRVYEPAGVFVAEPGRPVADAAARMAANQQFLDQGMPIEVRPRHVYVAGDIALLIVDYTIGPDPTGGRTPITGTATDVTRRGPDGRWRYVIDNPFGTA